MRALLQALSLAVLTLAPPVMADTYVPDARFVLTRDVDFYGADLHALFDTTYEACEATCRANPDCRAFTFNTRSNACFPKSAITDQQPYQGAWSAEKRDTGAGVLALAAGRAADLAYLGAPSLAAARALAEKIGWHHPSGQFTPDQMIVAANERRAAGDALNALRWTGGALAHLDRSDLWAEYARLSIDAKGDNNSTPYRSRAVAAAVNAYLRAENTGQRVSALEVLAQALEVANRGRGMIPALRLAQSLQPRDDIAAALDSAVARFGFRITDTRVDSDAAAPRLCAEFSEPLAKNVDYMPYVKLPDQTMAVRAEGRQICIDGADHGARYQVIFREGLPDASGERLIKDVALRLYVKDRTPSVVFPGRAYVLPKSPDAAVPVQTVNLTDLELTLRRVDDRNLLRAVQEGYFGQRLSYWATQDFAGNVGEEIWRGTGTVQNTLNRDMTTRLPMGAALAGQAPGLYALTARIPGSDPYDDPGAVQWFVLSDLGLTTLTGTDGLHVFVRGLGDAAARGGVTVTLVSRANRVLGTATTDVQGHAVFDAGLTRGTGGAAPAMVTAQADQDLAFLSLTDPAFDLSDRGVEGRAPSGAMDVFLATDRGAYRAGEVIHATALARNGVAAALPGVPLTAILTRPDGVEYSRALSVDDRAGGHVFALPLSASVPRGPWVLAIKADTDAPALAQTTLLVEDFLPERIDFDITLPDGPLTPAALPRAGIDARYLFGAPGADLVVEGDLRLSRADALPGYPGYRFGLYDDRFSPRSITLDGTRTDTGGRAALALRLPDIGDFTGPLEARLSVRVAEGSGRPVERREVRALAASGPMIGIKPAFADDLVPEGGEARFTLIAIGPDGTAPDLPVRWTLNRVETRYQWYQQYGDWNWEPVTTRQRVANGTAILGQTAVEVAHAVDWGRYELVVEASGGTYVASSIDFHAGWYAPADTAATPDMLDLSLDKPAYRAGDSALLRLVPRAGGQALITVLTDRVVAMQAVTVAEGENLIPLTVTDEWGAGAYVTAQVIRPMDVAAGRNPARALGLTHAAVDPGARALDVTLETPARSDPRAPLTATLRVTGVAAGEVAFATIAATDLGILNLTAFKSPDPQAHYFGQRRLGVDLRDVYGRLIDGMNGALGQVRSGGDAGAQMRLQSPPPTEDLVAFFTGPVTVGADGTATVTFDVPAFNGTVRLAAVAWSQTGVGQAEADVVVADPVVMTTSLPRFLAPGDQSRLLLELVHADGPSGRMGLDVTADGVALDAAAIPAGVTLTDKGKVSLDIPITAGDVGDHSLRIALTTPDGRRLVKDLTLGVRANDPAVSETRQITLEAGQALELGADVLTGLRPGTGQAVLSTGPLARLDVPGLLARLDRYPYGCTEQVTSQALPLLYLSSVAAPLGLGTTDRIATRIGQAVEQVLTRQASGGGFGLWRAEQGDFWLDAYVTDFLSRARAAGHAVPDAAFRTALDNLRNRVNYAADFDQGGEALAYALLVLAREGAAAMGDLRYYADDKADSFATPLAAAQLGTALAAYGDQTRADAMFAVAARALLPRMGDEATPVWRADYGSNLRDAAGVLALAVEAGSSVVNTAALTQRIAAAGRDLSTQESAWTLLAARALVDEPGASGLLLDGEPAGALVRRFADDLAHPLTLTNSGAVPVAVTLTTLGVPQVPAPAGGYGYAISRDYFTPEGAPVSPDAVATGARMVVVLRVTPFQDTGARLMVNDPLPAGFEIDNPNLIRAGDVAALDWLDPATPDHAEFRSDRFLAAVNWRSDQAFTLAYIVRAISPGSYHHPAATVEDMYRPQYRARTDTGRVQIGG